MGAKNKLKALLGKTQLPAPPSHFTEGVMKAIDASADESVFAEARLKAVLQRTPASIPPAHFTHKVLQQIKPQAVSQQYKPLISVRAWTMVSLFLLSCLIMALPDNTGYVDSTSYFGLIGRYLVQVFVRFVEPVVYTGSIVFSACLLLTLDYFLSKLRKV